MSEKRKQNTKTITVDDPELRIKKQQSLTNEMVHIKNLVNASSTRFEIGSSNF